MHEPLKVMSLQRTEHSLIYCSTSMRTTLTKENTSKVKKFTDRFTLFYPYSGDFLLRVQGV